MINLKREKVRRQIRRAAAAAAALMLAAAFSLPAGTEIMGVRLGNAIVASASDSGDFGEGDCLSWSYDSIDNILTISGNGAMPDSGEIPWIYWGFGGFIKTVVIEDGVTSIGNYAFDECTSLQSITIPDSVTSIGNYAFKSCRSLQRITIPGSVNSIGDNAFTLCSSLQSITIRDGVTSIGKSAFVSCPSLTSISIPKSVTSIGDYAFDECSGLIDITVDNDNPNYSSTDGVLFNKDKTTLIQYPASKSGDSYSIPSGVDSIGDCAFYGCGSLTSIDIPDSVTSIGFRAFFQCGNLTSIDIPDNVTSIGRETFRFCTNLASITIPSRVTSIGEQAFSNCDRLTSIFLPEGATVVSGAIPAAATQIKYTVDGDKAIVTDIDMGSQPSLTIPDTIGGKTVTAVFIEDGTTGVNVPTSATQIKYTVTDGKVTINGTTAGTAPLSLAIPEKIDGKDVTAIGDYAFSQCTSLESITIPDGVTSIGDNAFYECSSLESILVDEDNNNYSSEDGVLFDKNKTTLIKYPANKSGDSYVIPNGVVTIEAYAFVGCRNLTGITIPDGVISIGDDAFVGCRNLTSITIPDGVISIGDNAFWNCPSLTSITIPDSVESIGENAFFLCTSLESITIPDSVTSIGGCAFEGCSSLESIFLPEGLDVSNASIPDTTTKIIYTVDNDGNAAITKIEIPDGQDKPAIPEKIGEYPVISAAEEYQQYVGEHTHTGGTASCTEMGVCAICGQEYVGALGHDYGAPVFNWAEDNSCKAVFTCETDSTHVAEEDCEVSITASTDAVCETGGSVTYTAKVTFEGREYTDEKTVTVPAKGHNIVKVEKTEPTCTEDGYEAHYKCSVCGKLFSDSEGRNEISAEDIVIPAKGHDFEDGVCTVCGETDPDYSEPVEPEPEPEPTPDPEPVVVYYPVVISGNVAVDKPSAAAGDIVNVSTDFGYDVIVTDANGRRIAKIDWKGSFTMPDSKVYITVVRNETLGFMSNAWSHSYVYSYDSDMNRIKVNSDSKRGVIVIDLGSEYAGRDFTVYSGRKSTKTVIISSTLDENGRFTFEAPEGKNYTLVVE
ncbi:MAG: leucine-rich repeat domain-containing protein [Oscillospiraceae bacterium]|nr:leucine-rich repeat domain-containing protein [Oscillospiraceae bacterium]